MENRAGSREPPSRVLVPKRRTGLLATAFRRAMSIGPITTSELAAVVTIGGLGLAAPFIRLPVPGVVAAVAFVAIGTVLGSEAAIRAIPRRVRRGVEAVSFVGGWEQRRARALGIKSIPTTPEAAGRWLEAHPERPEDRWFRIEVLLVAGRLDEAAEVAARLPADTPWERFDRVLNDDWIAWSGGDDGNPAAVREAAAGVGADGDETRLRAEVAATIMEARRLAADGGDAIAPLAAVRDRLGDHPDARLAPEIRRRALVASLVGSTFVATLVYFEALAEFLVGLFR